MFALHEMDWNGLKWDISALSIHIFPDGMNFINLFDFEIGVWSCQYSDANTWVRPGRAGSDLLELKEFQEPTHHTACTMGKV